MAMSKEMWAIDIDSMLAICKLGIFACRTAGKERYACFCRQRSAAFDRNEVVLAIRFLAPGQLAKLQKRM